jgi:5-methylcytosine-specific restriction endonuclease McrA
MGDSLMPIDYSKYHPDWFNISKEVRRRAGDKCEKCGVPNYAVIKRYPDGSWRRICAQEREMIYSKIRYSNYTKSGALRLFGFTRIILTVHHIDFDISNNIYSNLIALCQRCHFKADAEYHKQNRKKMKKIKIYGDEKYQVKLIDTEKSCQVTI